MKTLAIFGFACLLFACKQKGEEAIPAPTKTASTTTDITYAVHVKPILDTFCMACHNGATYIPDLSTFDKLKPQVEAGLVYDHLFSKKDMPPYGSPAPSATDLKLIRSWLDSGHKP